MSVEEFRLRHATITSLAVPVIGSVAIEIGPGCSSDGDIGA